MDAENPNAQTPLLLLPALAVLTVVTGCSDMMPHSNAYSIEQETDGNGDPVLVYQATVSASDPGGALCNVTVGLTGSWDGQWSSGLLGEKGLVLSVTTIDGSAFEDLSFRLKPPAERPIVFGDDEFGGYVSSDTFTDANGAAVTRWIWQIPASSITVRGVQGYPSLDCSIGDYEFMLNDAQIRGMSDYLRRLENQ